MTDEKKLKFTCQECGAHEIGYENFVKCTSPVWLQENNNVEYGQSVMDDKEPFFSRDCFICLNCKASIEYRGLKIETEKQLIDYLSMDPDVREEEEKKYAEYIDAQIYDQEQTEEEQSLMDPY